MKCGKAVLLRKFLINSLPTAWIFSSVTTDPVDDSFSSILDKMFQFVDFEGNAERIFRRIIEFWVCVLVALAFPSVSSVFAAVWIELNECFSIVLYIRWRWNYDPSAFFRYSQPQSNAPTPTDTSFVFLLLLFFFISLNFFFHKMLFFFSSRRYFNVACKFEVSDFKSMIVKSVCVASGSLSQH